MQYYNLLIKCFFKKRFFFHAKLMQIGFCGQFLVVSSVCVSGNERESFGYVLWSKVVLIEAMDGVFCVSVKGDGTLLGDRARLGLWSSHFPKLTTTNLLGARLRQSDTGYKLEVNAGQSLWDILKCDDASWLLTSNLKRKCWDNVKLISQSSAFLVRLMREGVCDM